MAQSRPGGELNLKITVIQRNGSRGNVGKRSVRIPEYKAPSLLWPGIFSSWHRRKDVNPSSLTLLPQEKGTTEVLS